MATSFFYKMQKHSLVNVCRELSQSKYAEKSINVCREVNQCMQRSRYMYVEKSMYVENIYNVEKMYVEKSMYVDKSICSGEVNHICGEVEKYRGQSM